MLFNDATDERNSLWDVLNTIVIYKLVHCHDFRCVIGTILELLLKKVPLLIKKSAGRGLLFDLTN